VTFGASRLAGGCSLSSDPPKRTSGIATSGGEFVEVQPERRIGQGGPDLRSLAHPG